MKLELPVWLYPNLLSLDAPVVAVVWQAFISQCFGLPLGAPGRLALGLTVWCIYLLDRLLDVRSAVVGVESARHQFYRMHRGLAIGILAAVLSADILVIVFWLRPVVFRSGLLAFCAVVLYLALLHGKAITVRIPKEVVVAMLFTAGTFLVAWTGAANPVGTLMFPAFSFFLLCLGNLVTIEMWEWRELRGEQSGGPHATTIWLGRFTVVWMAALAGASFVSGDLLFYRAISLSAACTALICAVGGRLSMEVRRILVDAILLSPILFLL